MGKASAFQFANKELKSALTLYFEPLFWVIQKVRGLLFKHAGRPGPVRLVAPGTEANSRTDFWRASKVVGGNAGPRSISDYWLEDLLLNTQDWESWAKLRSFRVRSGRARRREQSVTDYWRTRLSDSKLDFFSSSVRELESAYGMFSVALEEAFQLYRSNQLEKAQQAVALTPNLCIRLIETLVSILRALGDHARECGVTPNVAPLDPSNYLGIRGQHIARVSMLLSRVLLSTRTQFLHKIGTLEELIEDIAKDFRVAAEDFTLGVYPDYDQRILEESHYDLNTCLRESIVLLKSFLVVLPEDQLSSFRNRLSSGRGLRKDHSGSRPDERLNPLTSDHIVYAKHGS